MKRGVNFFTKSVILILLTGFCIMISNSAKGQSNKEEVEFFQSIFGMEKKAITAEFLKLDSKDPFWTLYDNYENERKALGLNRLKILNDYVENYTTLTDDKTNEIIKQTIKQRKDLDNLIDKYYKKINKTSGAKVAAQFYHLENYLLSTVRLAILENIPAIDALE